MMAQTDEQEFDYWVDFEVYRVADKVESVDDEYWYEYQVYLMKAEDVIDHWDSRLATYNGSKSQRLTEKRATMGASDIKQDVERTQEPSKWFDIE